MKKLVFLTVMFAIFFHLKKDKDVTKLNFGCIWTKILLKYLNGDILYNIFLK
jgi:hypothetical protein